MNDSRIQHNPREGAQPGWKTLVRDCDDASLNFERLRGRWTEPTSREKKKPRKNYDTKIFYKNPNLP